MRQTRIISITLVLVAVISGSACRYVARTTRSSSIAAQTRNETIPINSPDLKKVVGSAIEQADYTLYYDPSYVKLDYPGGDVSPERGACTDVIIRAFRKADVDLQQRVHEDMARSFSVYPQKWGLAGPDANIDHRRVPNLMTYFKRAGKSVNISDEAVDYLPGDVIAWELNGGSTHIGLVTNVVSETTGNPLVAHNIGAGVKLEDVLFAWHIIGHYRYFQ